HSLGSITCCAPISCIRLQDRCLSSPTSSPRVDGTSKKINIGSIDVGSAPTRPSEQRIERGDAIEPSFPNLRSNVVRDRFPLRTPEQVATSLREFAHPLQIWHGQHTPCTPRDQAMRIFMDTAAALAPITGNRLGTAHDPRASSICRRRNG